jgi:hypothetical protein
LCAPPGAARHRTWQLFASELLPLAHPVIEQQLLAQAPGTIHILILLKRIGIVHEPQEVVAVGGEPGSQVAAQRNVGKRQCEIGGSQHIVHRRIRLPMAFVGGHEVAQALSFTALDEQPEQCLLHVRVVRCQRKGGIQVGQREAALTGRHQVLGGKTEEAGLLAKLGGFFGRQAADQLAHLRPARRRRIEAERLQQQLRVTEA